MRAFRSRRPIANGLLIAVLLAAAAGRLAAQEAIVDIVIRDTLPLSVGETQSLAELVNVQGPRGEVRGAALSYRSSDTSVVRLVRDTVVARRAGVATVLIRTTNARRPIARRLVVTVAGAAGYEPMRPDTAAAPPSDSADGAETLPGALSGGLALAAGDTTLGAGEVLALQPVAPGENGRPLTDAERRVVRWTVEDTTVAAVDASGRVTARGAGRTRVVAAGPGAADTVALAVHARLAQIAWAPAGDTLELSVAGVDSVLVQPLAADGRPVEGVAVAWRVGDTAVARFDSATRQVTGAGVGTTDLVAKLSGWVGMRRWVVRVAPPPIAFERRRLALAPGADEQLAVNQVDGRGRVLARAGEVRWSSSDSSVASVHDGLVRARRAGRATIAAAGPGGRRDSALVLVVPGLLVTAALPGGAPRAYRIDPTRLDTLLPLPLERDSVARAVYAPDRSRVALIAFRDGGGELLVGDADGGLAPERLASRVAAGSDVAWGGAGTTLTVGLPAGDSTVLHAVDVERRAWTRAGAALGRAMPAVSPDGAVVYVDGRPRDAELWLLPRDGSGSRRLTDTGGRKFDPHWARGAVVFGLEASRAGGRWHVAQVDTQEGVERIVASAATPIVAVAASAEDGTIAWVTAGRSREDAAVLTVRDARGVTRQLALPPGTRVLALSF